MLDSLSLEPQHSFLASYKIPILQAGTSNTSGVKASTPPTPFQQRMADPRAQSLRMILSKEAKPGEKEVAAEVKSKMAVSMWQAGKSEQALRMAEQSLDLFPKQWLAHLIKVDILMARNLFERAYDHLMSVQIGSSSPAWDRALSKKELHLCAASCQWRLKSWEKVDEHLRLAFPKGVKSMPAALQEDWFRLALYRHQADDAAEAAALLAGSSSLEFTTPFCRPLYSRVGPERHCQFIEKSLPGSPGTSCFAAGLLRYAFGKVK